MRPAGRRAGGWRRPAPRSRNRRSVPIPSSANARGSTVRSCSFVLSWLDVGYAAAAGLRSCPGGCCRVGGTLERRGHVGAECDRVPGRGRGRGGFETEQVGATGQPRRLGPDHFSRLAAQSVAHDSGATAPADCVSHLGKHAVDRWVDRNEDGTDGATRPARPRALQLREGGAGGDPADRRCGHLGRPQTVRRWRPLSRRDFRIERPARVDMRLRNPWVLARFRVFGW